MRKHLILMAVLLVAALACSGCPAKTEKKGPEQTAANPQPTGTVQPPGANPAPLSQQKPLTEPTKYVEPAPHGAADTPAAAKTDKQPGAQAQPQSQSPVASVIGRDANAINTGKVTTVVLETTKGDIAIDVHEKWAEQAYGQFLQLVRVGFYDGAPWYRVIGGFAAQAGISPEPTVNSKWSLNKIMDDPLVKSNLPGYVSFAQNGKETRSTKFFINLTDNSSVLDSKGYVPFGVVTSGQEIALKLTPISDQQLTSAGLSQDLLAKPGGMEAFKKAFPQADYIIRARILE
jgi:peptidyl-prolyl cis-trans isomerase A (cyclophilin A)